MYQLTEKGRSLAATLAAGYTPTGETSRDRLKIIARSVVLVLADQAERVGTTPLDAAHDPSLLNQPWFVTGVLDSCSGTLDELRALHPAADTDPVGTADALLAPLRDLNPGWEDGIVE